MRSDKKILVVLLFIIVFIGGELIQTSSHGSGLFGLGKVFAQEAIDLEKVLLIRDLSVIEDPTRTFNPCTGEGTPMGKWTFGYLMSELANEPVTGLEPGKFTRNWLRQWGQNITINGDIVRIRSELPILRPWEEAGNGVNQPLDLSIAPFRLLAIVNRIDMYNDLDFGGEGAGEARFVFGAVDLENDCQPLQFTVNFEYLIKKDSCLEIKNWAQEWQNLSNFELGTQEYNAALEQITEQFVAAGSDPDMRPNHSTLNTLVSNENFLGDPWELRAFKLIESGRGRGLLGSVTTKQAPNDVFNRSETLVNWINENEASILARDYTVPLTLADGTQFLGGNSIMRSSTHWAGPRNGPEINSNEARHIFSLNTCAGCHARETGTTFTHVRPGPFGVVPNLSGFMTGIDVLDPGDRTTVRHFNELERRAVEFDSILNLNCTP